MYITFTFSYTIKVIHINSYIPIMLVLYLIIQRCLPQEKLKKWKELRHAGHAETF